MSVNAMDSNFTVLVISIACMRWALCESQVNADLRYQPCGKKNGSEFVLQSIIKLRSFPRLLCSSRQASQQELYEAA